MEKRLAVIDDVPVMVKLRKQQLIDEELPSNPNIDTNIEKQLADYFNFALADGSFISWVVENDGEIIATSGVCFYVLPPYFSNPTGQTAYVTNMYTKPEYRKKGIATELLNLVIEEAKSRGYKVIRLHTSDDGKSIYQKAGFTDSDGYMVLRV
ncbi:MAG: GNAT family N-acetyltransferase [Oscillospiraceae bacterium]|nr:GNAT family N-acetyltransferase [Oscillospiraceae bacterium]